MLAAASVPSKATPYAALHPLDPTYTASHPLYTPLHTPLTPPCSGTFECFVKRADDGLEDPRGRLVLSYAEGSTFGELALMYNTPRAASIVASSDSVLWAMDRETFRTVILQVE